MHPAFFEKLKHHHRLINLSKVIQKILKIKTEKLPYIADNFFLILSFLCSYTHPH